MRDGRGSAAGVGDVDVEAKGDIGVAMVADTHTFGTWIESPEPTEGLG